MMDQVQEGLNILFLYSLLNAFSLLFWRFLSIPEMKKKQIFHIEIKWKLDFIILFQ